MAIGKGLAGRVASLCEEVRPGLADERLQQAVQSVEANLLEPLRVAVAGRVSSGKSTLVNALLGRRIAPTDVGECTRLVTRFRFGNPERMEIVGRDGSRQAVGLLPDGTLPELGVDVSNVRHLDVHLSNETLQQMTVIDTPGLASASDRSDQQLAAIDDRSRAALAHAEAVLFMLAPTTRRDEMTVLKTFRELFSGIRASAVNAVGVLSKVDKLGEDDDDPWPVAHRLAEHQTQALNAVVSSVVPVIGLLAETSSSTEFSEEDALDLRRLAELPPKVRVRMLLSVESFRNAELPIPSERRERLLRLLDLHGIGISLAAIDQGKVGAAALVPELRAASGVDGLAELVRTTFRRQGDAIKADWAIAALTRLSYAGDDESLRGLRSRLEDVRLAPEMHRVEEIAALHDVASGTVALSPGLRADLERAATESALPTRLGLPAGASRDELRQGALDAATRWRAYLNDPRTGRPQARVAATMCRSFELMLGALGGVG
jgi:predicted GTPase